MFGSYKKIIMTKVTKKIGIDISKLTFDVCFINEFGNEIYSKYNYNHSGISNFINSIPSDSHCVMESTGVYHTRLAYALFDAGIEVSIINPLVAKNYSRMLMKRTKTDKADASLLRSYAETLDEQLEIWEPSDDSYIVMQQLLKAIELLEKSLIGFRNQLEAIENSYIKGKLVIKTIKNHIKTIENNIKKLNIEMQELLHKEQGDLLKRIKTIPGVGDKVVTNVIVATRGLKKFNNYRQISSYFGLSPRQYESGSSVKGKASICKMGMSRIRKLLYLAALSASRYNDACANLYNRLIEKGKPKKLALIAVANKLIKQIFAIAKSNKSFMNNYQF